MGQAVAAGVSLEQLGCGADNGIFVAELSFSRISEGKLSHAVCKPISGDTFDQLLTHACRQEDFVYLGSVGDGDNRGLHSGFSALASDSLCQLFDEDQPLGPNAIAASIENTMAPFAETETAHPRDEASPGLTGGWVGFISYEFGYDTETRLHTHRRPLSVPLLKAGLYLWMASYNRETQQHYLWMHPDLSDQIRSKIHHWSATPAASESRHWGILNSFQARQNKTDFKASVERVRAYITAGDCYQANLSQAFSAAYTGDPWLAFCALSETNPTPHSAFIRAGNASVMSVSPERFLTIRGTTVTTSPIKGTRPRGDTAELDTRLAQDLMDSAKDKAENLMIVDLLRNDLSRNAVEGSVQVDQLFALESYRSVHHLVSHIRCELAPGVTPMKALFDAFPGGSITGAPKIRAMEIIRELEPHDRGPYCGSVFFRGLDGSLESNIAIRTLYCDGNGDDDVTIDGMIHCCGGGGIVADSDPESEYQETLTKVKPLMDFLETLGSQ